MRALCTRNKQSHGLRQFLARGETVLVTLKEEYLDRMEQLICASA